MDNDIKIEKNETLELNKAIKEITSAALGGGAIRDENAEVETVATPNTENEVMLFLGEELEPLRRAKHIDVYDLETEYAKTCKNKLWSVWIMLSLTFLVVVLVTVFTVGGLSASNERIDVNFSSFKDLDLQNLFSQLQRTQESFDEATKRYAELKGGLESRLSQAKMKLDNDIAALKNTRLSRAALQARREKIQSDYNAEVAAIHSEIDADLAAADAEVKQYEEQLKSYDSENVARAQEWENRMDSERQVYQLERQRLSDSYENQLENARVNLENTKKKALEERLAATNELTARYEEEISTYDPIIKDSKMSGLLNDMESVQFKKFDAESFIASDPNLSENFAYVLRDLQVDCDNLDFLYGHSSSIPQRNTMKDVVSSEQKLSAGIANKITSAAIEEMRERNLAVASLNQQIKTMENQRDYARNAANAYVGILNRIPVSEGTAGFVINPAGNYGVAIFILNQYSQTIRQDGSTRIQFYDGEDVLATGAVFAVSGNYYVSLDNNEDAQNLSVGNVFKIISNSGTPSESVPATATEEGVETESATEEQPVSSEPATPESDATPEVEAESNQ